ncbi:MAG: hypothetical protein ACI8WB_004949 [Phenylobacterium sp.]|jgi:hypothetical protein
MVKILTSHRLLLSILLLLNLNLSTFAEENITTVPPTPEMIPEFKVIDQELINRYKNLYRNRTTGAKYDPATGSVTFAVTDISIPGNSGLPVELSRWITGDDLRTGGFGGIGWQWDIPVIKASYMDEYWHDQASGTPLIEPGGWYSGKNCSESYSPAPGVRVVGNPQAHNAPAYTYWSGKQLHIPGKTTEKFLENTASPGIKAQITKSNFYVSSCLPLADGEEGFIVKGPDGTTYTFDQIKTYRNGAMPPALTSPLSTFTKLIMISKIEDRFGNTVEYHYNTHQDLDHILASDGRRIDVAYTSYSYKNQTYYIAQTATANDKTWTYQYTDYVADTQSADKRKFLTDVAKASP